MTSSAPLNRKMRSLLRLVLGLLSITLMISSITPQLTASSLAPGPIGTLSK